MRLQQRRPPGNSSLPQQRSQNVTDNVAFSSFSLPLLKNVEQMFNERFGGDFEQRRGDDSLVLKKVFLLKR
ncbi:hypothetical protein BASA81_009096 [Batrachochytrium salamandrivorans]|nr:hypothetical protein BASA81_009096 [Batrachochytrium salamandrivorans]